MALLISAIMAVLVNVSTFLIIGRTSAITYNMVGHGKLVLILLCGYLFFGGALSLWNLIGVALAIGGIMTYSYLTIK
jgi:solute carrier family 35 protein E3